MIEYNEVLIYSDQPQTCPKCGSRTDILLDLSHTSSQTQIHKCYNERCAHLSIIEID
jgi:hypothetical protein